MKNKMYELKNQRVMLLDAAEKALSSNEMELYTAKMEEVKKLNAEIAALESLEAEKGRFEKEDAQMVTLSQKMEREKEDERLEAKLDAARSGNEYAQAFAQALRMGHNIQSGRMVEALKPLYAALTEGGGSPAGADGGFLVPLDFDDMIHKIRRNQVALADLVFTENVTTLKGWRAVDTAPTKGFTKMTEMGNVPKDDQPKFRKVEYAIDSYGLIVPISNELAEDNTAGLLRYLARWFGPKGVLTENALIKEILDTLSPVTLTAGKELAGIKNAMNTKVDPAISARGVFITNQTGFDHLDNLVDGQNRPLLQPDPTSGTPMMFKNKRVIMLSDALLPNKVASGTFAPIYFGDYEQFVTLFRRKALEVASTTIGGNAWSTNSTEYRGIMRLDAQKMDEQAAVKMEIKTA